MCFHRRRQRGKQAYICGLGRECHPAIYVSPEGIKERTFAMEREGWESQLGETEEEEEKEQGGYS